MSSGISRRLLRYFELFGGAKLGKIIADYIHSRDEWRRAVQKLYRVREEFVGWGLILAVRVISER
jgi:hypothetical protein